MSECLHNAIPSGSGVVKVVIPLPDDSWHGFSAELAWCEVVREGVVRMLNTPFFAKGISYKDLLSIRVEPNSLLFDSVVAKSGHSSYRILLADSTTDSSFQRRWLEMAALGCSYESFLDGRLRLYAVDVPDSADVVEVYRLLDLGEADGIWDFDEGNYGKA